MTMRSETPTDPTYGYTAHLPGVSFEDARSRVADALKQQGFGVLTDLVARMNSAAGMEKTTATAAVVTEPRSPAPASAVCRIGAV